MLLCLLVLAIPEREKNGLPHLRSESVVVRYADTGETLLSKNPTAVRPIASVTKLMSGLVLDGIEHSVETPVTICDDDKDKLKWSKSRLKVGLETLWKHIFHAALGASDNRAMYASVRAAGVERKDFVVKMNEQAKTLGMKHSVFKDPAGIDPENVSTANDLVLLVDAAAKSKAICEATLMPTIDVADVQLTNPNRLARSGRWEVLVGKTGYTVEAGRALVLRAVLNTRPVDIILVGAREMASVFGDAGRIRRWLEQKSAVSVR